jgi:hypothetical protein
LHRGPGALDAGRRRPRRVDALVREQRAEPALDLVAAQQ